LGSAVDDVEALGLVSEELLILFYLGIFLGSLLLSFVLTRYVRDVATARGWVASPALDRHLHSRPLPRLGGIAIFLSFLTVFTFAIPIAGFALGADSEFSYRTVIAILLPGLVIFALGAFDDLSPLGPYTKFAVQASAAAMLYAGGLRIVSLPLVLGGYHFPWFLSLPLTIIWVLAITNAFNLIDGLDGLAAGSALFSTLVVFVVSLITRNNLVSAMAIALVGATLGFLRFNFSPATIFLGDCGSLFVGFMLSALALQGAQKAPTTIAVAIPVVSFGLPILETTLSILRRFLSGRPVFTADREHIHHKLLQQGLSQRQVAITLYAVSAVFALLSLFLLWPTQRILGLVLAVVGCGVWIGVQRLGYLEFGELRRVAQRTIERQVLINNLAIRRATEELRVARDYAQLCRTLLAAMSNNDFDAFDLHLLIAPLEAPEAHGPGLRFTSDGLYWTRPGTYFSREMGNAWSLSLDLVSSNNIRYGRMTVHRCYTDRDLQIDLNLLTANFSRVLADALERLLSPVAEVIPILEQKSELLAAQAS